MDIKETKELLEGMGDASVIAKKIVNTIKEHGVGPQLLMIIKDINDNIDDMKEAIDGISKVPSELKDLDESEVFEIIGDLYSQAKKINEA